jgi:hypothetical protein
LIKKETEQSNNKNSGKNLGNRNFIKNEGNGMKQKFQPIAEEGEKKIISLEINKSIKVNICSLL